jgi:hypothetical protein
MGALIGTISSNGAIDLPDHDWFVIGSGGTIAAS